MHPKLFMLLVLCILPKQYKAIRKSEPFSCVGKVIGGYYTDVLSGCQMFHVCTLDGKGELQDIVFGCIDGTVFEQETRVCEREEEVNCETSEDFFYLNNELYGPGIIPDTANDNSFKTDGHAMTINGSIKRPKDLTKGVFVRASRPTSTWSVKLPWERRFSSFPCDAKPRSGFYADGNFGCQVFHLCIELKSGRLKLKQSYSCSENGAWFDERMGKCVTTFPSKCTTSNRPDSPVAVIEGSPENMILSLCKDAGHDGLVPDLESNCKRYFRCKFINGKISLESYECEPSLSYSSKYKMCKKAQKNSCKMEIPTQVSKTRFDIRIGGENLNVRFRRSSLLENHNNHRESSSGPLTRAGGIFSDVASVIENPSPGNIVIEGSNIPKKDRRDKFEKTFTTVFAPHTSHAKNQTLRNGTVVEVSEISSPDQDGKVTITSIVPKFVRLNGNNQPNRLATPSITFSSIQRKVTLSGVNSTLYDSDPLKMTDVTKSMGNDSLSDNETLLEIDGLSTHDPELDSSTFPITSETTELMEESTTKPVDIETTTIPKKKSPPDTKSSTQLSQDEIIETNFTCRDKELERFYPDIEAECKVFHYCAPGFSEDQVLDLKFLCTGETRFDSGTSKCLDQAEVSCEIPKVLYGLSTISADRSKTKITSPEATTPSSSTVSTQKMTSTSTSVSTQRSTEASSSPPSETSSSTQPSALVVSMSIPPLTTVDKSSSISPTDTEENSSITTEEEHINKTPLPQISTSTSDSSDPVSEIITGSTVPSTESTVSTISTTTPTSKVSTSEGNTQGHSEESTVETTIKEVIPSTPNMEKALFSTIQETTQEKVVTSPDYQSEQMTDKEMSNETLTLVTDIFEYKEENATTLVDTENMATDMTLQPNTTTTDTANGLFSDGGATTSQENNLTGLTTPKAGTSMPPEVESRTSSEMTEDQTISDKGGTKGATDITTEDISTTYNPTTV